MTEGRRGFFRQLAGLLGTAALAPAEVFRLPVPVRRGPNVLTLADYVRRMDPQPRMEKIAELLSQPNPIVRELAGIPFMVENEPTGTRVHRKEA